MNTSRPKTGRCRNRRGWSTPSNRSISRPHRWHCVVWGVLSTWISSGASSRTRLAHTRTSGRSRGKAMVIGISSSVATGILDQFSTTRFLVPHHCILWLPREISLNHDFYKVFERAAQHELLQLPEVQQVDLRSFTLSPSEIMTILIAFHLSQALVHKST